jgi:hypothetical protein
VLFKPLELLEAELGVELGVETEFVVVETVVVLRLALEPAPRSYVVPSPEPPDGLSLQPTRQSAVPAIMIIFFISSYLLVFC